MKKVLLILILSQLNIIAQLSIEFLDSVPQKFKDKYYSNPRNFNPLQVGNVWEYYYDDYTYPIYVRTMVIKDSVINGIKYYKKINWQSSREPELTSFISWERNDSATGISWMLDFQDIDEDGDSLDELILDSMVTVNRSRSLTYKYSFNNSNFPSGPKHIFLYDTSWIKIDGDTLLNRSTEITEIFWQENIADNFGIWETVMESPPRNLTGAIVNGRKYGTIVGLNENKQLGPSFNLYQNYPNPFNPSTTIKYSIPMEVKSEKAEVRSVTVKVFDILGREVATLVNEKKAPGNYQVEFNSNSSAGNSGFDQNQPSGIYFYTLTSGSLRITKKMVFLK